jgi:hypothetical protein
VNCSVGAGVLQRRVRTDGTLACWGSKRKGQASPRAGNRPSSDGLVEPGCSFVEQVPERPGIVGVELERDVPMRVGPVLHTREATVRGVGFRHRLTDQYGFGQDLGLSRVRLEGLAPFQAERPQRRMEEGVARLDRLTLDHVVEPLPVLLPAWRQAAPYLRARIENLRRRRIVTLLVGIHLQVRECLLRTLRIGVGQSYAEEDVEGR